MPSNEILCPHCAFLQVIQPSDRLRELRKWHWLQVNIKRESARSARAMYYKTAALSFDLEANMHMKFVQTLNDFFPEGDTAEKDCQ